MIIPHAKGIDQTTAVSAFTKFPPLGERSIAGGRPYGYGGWAEEQPLETNRQTLCSPQTSKRR